MGLIDEALAYIDARKRALGRNVAEVVRDPSYLSQLFDSAKRPQERERARAQDEARLRAGGGLLGTSVMPGVDKPTESPYFDAAMNAPMGLLGAIKVYHGSPHKFDKFDLSKMGTGEGAQAYGWGGYLAEEPSVARQYADALSHNRPASVEGGGVKASIPAWLADQIERDGIDSAIKEWTKRIGEMKAERKTSIQPWLVDNNIAGLQNTLDAIKRIKASGRADVTKPNQLYEASLRWPDPAREASDPLGPQHFLDWDKPLSEQAEVVQDAINKAMPTAKPYEQLRAEYERIQAKLSTLPTYSAKFDQLHRKATDLSRQMDLAQKKGAATGADVYNLIGSGVTRQDVASQRLADLGIPGIRYLDGGSRSAGQGTHNYVVFDDALIELLKRNGVPIGGK